MKKIIVILLNVLMVLSLFAVQAGCSEQGDVSIKHDFTISHTNVTMEVGEEFLLISSCGDCEITFVSVNTECATVTNNGVIKAVKVGKTFIEVTSQEENSKRVCEVTVIAPEYSVVFEDSINYLVFVGGCPTVNAKTLRDGVKYKGEITFSVNKQGATILQTSDTSATILFSQIGEYEVFATDQFGNYSKIIISVIDNA